MKRACLFTIVAVLSLAQRSRDDYRAVYRAWQQTDPNLEKEATAGGAPIAQRADRLAAEAAKSAAARKVFLEGSSEDEARQISSLENTGVIMAPESAATSTRSDTQFIRGHGFSPLGPVDHGASK